MSNLPSELIGFQHLVKPIDAGLARVLAAPVAQCWPRPTAGVRRWLTPTSGLRAPAQPQFPQAQFLPPGPAAEGRRSSFFLIFLLPTSTALSTLDLSSNTRRTNTHLRFARSYSHATDALDLLLKMTRGNQRDKAREANQKKLAASVSLQATTHPGNRHERASRPRRRRGSLRPPAPPVEGPR